MEEITKEVFYTEEKNGSKLSEKSINFIVNYANKPDNRFRKWMKDNIKIFTEDYYYYCKYYYGIGNVQWYRFEDVKSLANYLNLLYMLDNNSSNEPEMLDSLKYIGVNNFTFSFIGDYLVYKLCLFGFNSCIKYIIDNLKPSRGERAIFISSADLLIKLGNLTSLQILINKIPFSNLKMAHFMGHAVSLGNLDIFNFLKTKISLDTVVFFNNQLHGIDSYKPIGIYCLQKLEKRDINKENAEKYLSILKSIYESVGDQFSTYDKETYDDLINRINKVKNGFVDRSLNFIKKFSGFEKNKEYRQ
jgi:hypothetical protein